MFFDDQNGYITASYAITVIVFIVLIVWTLKNNAKQKKALADLEQQGIIRQDKEKNTQ